MKVKILFDKDTEDRRLHRGWGVSFLIDDKILFDTGEKWPWLVDNMKKLGVDLKKIEAVVISHEHWDHIGGLWELLKKRKNLKVYGCFHFSREFKEKIKNTQGKFIDHTGIARVAKNIYPVRDFAFPDKTSGISNGVYVTGEIAIGHTHRYVEQALLVKTDKGISVFIGCSHPGITRILEEVREKFPQEKIYLVLGGFHLIDEDKRVIKLIIDKFKKLGVKKAGPSHCSGYEAKELFKMQYKDNFLEIKVGETVEV